MALSSGTGGGGEKRRLTETRSDGRVIVHPAGSVFFEKKDDVHNAQSDRNRDGGLSFRHPALIPAANPGGVCHQLVDVAAK
jgi:hypothetical protein